MRQRSGTLNRAWLAVVGVVLLLGGATVGAVTLGFGGPLRAATGLALPDPTRPVFGAGLGAWFAQPVVAVVVALVGLVLALAGIGWLVAQIPRTNPARPFRLTDDPVTGLTTCSPGVLTDAVAADATALPGVTAASAVLRGTAERPELTLRVNVNERADVRDVLHRLQNETVERLATAMGTPLAHLAVQVDVTPAQRTVDRVVL